MRASGAVLLLAVAVWPARARAADSAETCARAAEEAQVLRGRGKLRDAFAELRTCLRTFCPEMIRRDCAAWQVEVEASTPTVILSAHSAAGDDLVDAHASVDGLPFLERLDGMARPLDPGPHRFRFETPRSLPVDVEVVLREGEKRRPILVTFGPGAPRDGETSRPLPIVHGSAESRPSSGLPWALAGLGVASLAGFAAAGLTGLGDLHALRDGCGRTGTCAPSDVTSVRTRLWLADGFLGVGILSTSLAGWLWWRPRTAGRLAGASFRIAVSSGPGLLMERRF